MYFLIKSSNLLIKYTNKVFFNFTVNSCIRAFLKQVYYCVINHFIYISLKKAQQQKKRYSLCMLVRKNLSE